LSSAGRAGGLRKEGERDDIRGNKEIRRSIKDKIVSGIGPKTTSRHN
jgi:hypothetical protein